MSCFVRRGASLGAIGLVTAAPFGVATAQDADPADGGVLVELVGSQTVLASDNFDLEDPADGSVVALTGLGGAISSVTRSNAFVLGFQVGLEVDEEGFELGDSGIDLSYMMMGRDSEFELFADYLRSSITTEILEDGDVDFSVTSGTRNTYGYGARLLLGAEGPFTFALEGERRSVEFDSQDPDATDSRSFVLDGSVSAAVDRATVLRVTAGYTETDEDDPADTFETTTSVGLGITRALGNATSVSADINWQEVRTTTVGNRLSTIGYRRRPCASTVSAILPNAPWARRRELGHPRSIMARSTGVTRVPIAQIDSGKRAGSRGRKDHRAAIRYRRF